METDSGAPADSAAPETASASDTGPESSAESLLEHPASASDSATSAAPKEWDLRMRLSLLQGIRMKEPREHRRHSGGFASVKSVAISAIAFVDQDCPGGGYPIGSPLDRFSAPQRVDAVAGGTSTAGGASTPTARSA